MRKVVRVSLTNAFLYCVFDHLVNAQQVNQLSGEALFIISSIIHLGKSGLSKTNITEDDLDRLSTTLRLLVDQWPDASAVFLNECRAALDLMLQAKGDVDRHEDTKLKKAKIVQVVQELTSH